MSLRTGVLAALVAVACSSKSEVKGGAQGSAGRGGPSFTLIALAEMRGQIGPCGCTSDPLGDISRTAKLIEAARAAGPTLVVDAGGLLYSKSPVPPHLDAQEELKADLLTATYKDALGVAAVGLGPADLAKGPEKVRLPRQVVNVQDPKLPVEAPKVIELGGLKVGVFGVVGLARVGDLPAGDPIAPSKAAIAQLEQQGAQVIVALVQADSKRDAVKLVRDIGGIDVAVAGLGLAAPEPEVIDTAATKVGDGWLVVPGNRGQVVSKLDITLRGTGPLADAIGPGGAAAKTQSIDKQLAGLDADLAKFAADKDADPAFVARKQAEREELAKQKAQLAQSPLVVPASGPYFTLDQIRVNKQLACAVQVQDSVTAFNRAAGDANVKAAAAVPVAPVPAGTATFVGGEACDDCHSDAVTFWKTTRHAQAWETLEERGQQFDFDCVGCHVTGWERPGGSTLAHNETLRDVQCETCHGPGSIHVAKGGEEQPPAVTRMPDEKLCATQCHTKEHSDTFDLQPYLRDIVGKGHGEALRRALADGPTGHELRKAALDKAGRDLGSGCVR
ncbi:MAG TPA: multiheme c-type cytochrome [Kofleriaceae bacterium]|nr:multiheme c-type cytochrome [Kofleriaceae bacterium]